MLISALVAEDHDLTRRGIRSLLEDQLDARVVATTGDGLEVVPLLEEHEPDLLVLDLGLPHLNGLNILRKIQDSGLSVQVVILSMHQEDAYVSEAFDLGVSSYVLKGAPTDDVIAAVRAAVAGERYLGSGLSEEILAASRSAESGTGDRYDRLTDREREVLQLTAEGYTSKEIGERLYISHRTVDKHREHIQAKLGVSGTVEMTAYAHRRGLLPAPPPLDENAESQPDDESA
jgi:DNA-binding NarL/FixJ family response regulator